LSNYHRPDIGFENLDQAAHKISDIHAADQLHKACLTIFKTIHEQVLKTR